PTSPDFGHRSVGRAINRPTCDAMPTLRGCSIPFPSNMTASGSVFNFAQASNTEGVSRNDSNPGTYGNFVSLTTPTSSTTSRDGRRSTTTPAYTAGSNLLKLMSAPAIVSIFFFSGKTRTRARNCFCNSTASRGASDERGDGQEVARRGTQGRTRNLLELGERARERRARAEYADALPHQTPHALSNGERRRARAPRIGARSRTRIFLFDHARLF